jgi:hypothetical protein
LSWAAAGCHAAGASAAAPNASAPRLVVPVIVLASLSDSMDAPIKRAPALGINLLSGEARLPPGQQAEGVARRGEPAGFRAAETELSRLGRKPGVASRGGQALRASAQNPPRSSTRRA